jgi:CRISPR-associated protein Cmr3
MTTLFIEPLDVLFFRGNKLFGEAGSFGLSLVPPWPSVAAGAIRTAMMSAKALDFKQFASGQVNDLELGTPSQPGTFTLIAFHLAKLNSNFEPEPVFQLPADLSVSRNGTQITINQIRPLKNHEALLSSCKTALLPVLIAPTRNKAEIGWWLNSRGWHRYQQGESLNVADLISSSKLWGTEPRVGIGMNQNTKSVEEGKLFTSQATSFKPGVGFVARIAGANIDNINTVRLGGDGRGAASQVTSLQWGIADFQKLSSSRRCKIVLTTPGLFERGWLPTGFTQSEDGLIRFELMGIKAKLVCAVVPRGEVISGWDLAKAEPKPAQRAVSTSAVYWLDDLEATPELLGKVADHGLWSESRHNTARRAEGFNRFSFAAW